MSVLTLAVNPEDHYLGNLNAAITLVEYGDFECGGCRRAHSLIKRLLEEKGEELHFVFRHFPLRMYHPNAYAAAVAAEAAGKQGKFWEMHDLIYQNQKKLSENFLLSLADELNLDRDQYTIDMKSDEISGKIEKDYESGIRSGVNGTPTFFKNGFRLLTYDQTYDSLLRTVRIESEI